MAMAASIWDRALRAALVLPLRLLLLVLIVLLRIPYLLRRSTAVGGRPGVLSSGLLLVSVPILLSVIFTVSDPRTSNNAVSMLEEMKMKVAHLESKLEETTQALSFQALYLEDQMKLVEEMEREVQYLENESFGTEDLVFTKYNEAIDQLYNMRDAVGRISLKDIDDYNAWLMDICEWTNDELVCIDSLTLADFSRAGNGDDGENEENDGVYMYDNNISPNDDKDDVFYGDDDVEAAEENDTYKYDEDFFSDVEDGDYDIDDDYFSFDGETKGDNDDDYKSIGVAYDDDFLEEIPKMMFSFVTVMGFGFLSIQNLMFLFEFFF